MLTSALPGCWGGAARCSDISGADPQPVDRRGRAFVSADGIGAGWLWAWQPDQAAGNTAQRLWAVRGPRTHGPLGQPQVGLSRSSSYRRRRLAAAEGAWQQRWRRWRHRLLEGGRRWWWWWRWRGPCCLWRRPCTPQQRGGHAQHRWVGGAGGFTAVGADPAGLLCPKGVKRCQWRPLDTR